MHKLCCRQENSTQDTWWCWYWVMVLKRCNVNWSNWCRFVSLLVSLPLHQIRHSLFSVICPFHPRGHEWRVLHGWSSTVCVRGCSSTSYNLTAWGHFDQSSQLQRAVWGLGLGFRVKVSIRIRVRGWGWSSLGYSVCTNALFPSVFSQR